MCLTLIAGLIAALVIAVFGLVQARSQLHTIAGHAPSAIAHVVGRGANLKYRFVNQKYASLYGREAATVIGKSPRQILGPEVFVRSHPNMLRAIAGETVTFDLQLGQRTVEVTYFPDRGRGFIGVITDVTDLRALQLKDRKN